MKIKQQTVTQKCKGEGGEVDKIFKEKYQFQLKLCRHYALPESTS